MKRESIIPESRAHWLQLRRQDITSTDCAALFGLSPYKTYYQLWHEKRGLLDEEFKESERMEWGPKLEELIAHSLCERMGKEAPYRMSDYGRLPDHRLGSSFDFCLIPSFADPRSELIECKNVDAYVYNSDWSKEYAPPHIEMQVQHQMLVSGLNVCHIAALVGGNKLVHIRREAHEPTHQAILDKAAEFWAMDVAPQPDLDRDTEVIGRLCGFAQPGLVVECDEGPLHELLLFYQELKAAEKGTKKRIDEVKAQILLAIGEAEKVKGPGWTISAGMVGPAQVSYERKGYRNFRVSFKENG